MKSTTPIPSPTGLPKDFGLTHNHQIPRSNGAAPTSAPKQVNTTPVIVPKTKRSVNSQAVLDSVSHKPRKHLGDVVYDSSLTPAKLMSPSRFGFASTPRPLPMAMIRDNENSTLTVKIPRAHLTTVAREEITTRRAIWGTDVYSDDSDVVAACIHAGWIRGEWSNDIDTDLLDLRVQPTKSKGRNAAPPAADQGPQEVLTSPPTTGPVQVPHHRDLHVTLLILPALEKYTSTTRFGIQSREFGGTYNGRKSTHDGISFMITAIRWVDGAAPQSRLRGKARRERIRKAMSEVQRAHVLDIGGDSKKLQKKLPPAPTTTKIVNSSVDGDKENNYPAVTINGSNGVVDAKPSPSPAAEKAHEEVREPSSNAEGPAKVESVPAVEIAKAV
ncbi:histone deacetylation protein rxt3 [Apiospora rasikravindrae]|uniref:Histone deacetylation protein rxt3 n=1 Tax=Apiospora rasikravindrae TaxID=990691 RepID=A0ABR1T0K7_9PEZI